MLDAFIHVHQSGCARQIHQSHTAASYSRQTHWSDALVRCTIRLVPLMSEDFGKNNGFLFGQRICLMRDDLIEILSRIIALIQIK